MAGYRTRSAAARAAHQDAARAAPNSGCAGRGGAPPWSAASYRTVSLTP